MTVSQVAEKMIAASGGNLHDIGHFMKVYALARTIGTLEGLERDTQDLLEIAAIVHDIACPLCREKYGDTNGAHQEAESPALVRAFLADCGLPQAVVDRVAYLAGHHHSPQGVDGPDYQILLEADFLVNAAENHLPEENIQTAGERLFRTESGTRLLRAMYQI